MESCLISSSVTVFLCLRYSMLSLACHILDIRRIKFDLQLQLSMTFGLCRRFFILNPLHFVFIYEFIASVVAIIRIFALDIY
jgi:hypothetical protein